MNRCRAIGLGDKIEHLPTGHALRSDARASSITNSDRTNGSSWVAGSAMISNARSWKQSPPVRRSIHRRRDERSASPAEVVIVHAWQIVMDQRIDMDRLDRCPGTTLRSSSIWNRRPVATVSRGGCACHRPGPRCASPRTAGHVRRRSFAGSGRRPPRPWRQCGWPRSRARPRTRRPQAASNGFVPCGWPSGPSAICSIRACAAFNRASQCRFSRSPRW